MHSRPLPVTVAAILMTLISLVGLPGPLLPGSEEVPGVVIYPTFRPPLYAFWELNDSPAKPDFTHPTKEHE
jgi:hypothetical protein